MNDLLKYQWIDNKIQMSTEIADAFYQVSGGIIDQLVGVYMFTQIDYLLASKKYTIQPKHIREAAEKHYPGMQVLLKGIDSQSEKARKEIIKRADLEMEMIIQTQQQDIAAQEIIAQKANSSKQETDIMRDKMICNIQNTLQVTEELFDPQEIEHAVDTVLKTKTNRGKSEKDLSANVYQLLKKRKQNNATTSKNKQKDKVPLDVLLNSITKITSPSDDDTP